MKEIQTKSQAVGETRHNRVPSLDMAIINCLDFGMIRLKLQDAEEGSGWTEEQCKVAELEYRRFLALKRHYANEEIVPNQLVDRFWHQHILDTRKYAEDCEAIFGEFLHHYPYFGMNGEEDYTNLRKAYARTQELYQRHFGEEAPEGNYARCRTQCKPQKCK